MKSATLAFTASGIALDVAFLILLGAAPSANILASATFFMSLALFTALMILCVWDADFHELYGPVPILEGKRKEKMLAAKLIISLGFFFQLVASFVFIAGIGA